MIEGCQGGRHAERRQHPCRAVSRPKSKGSTVINTRGIMPLDEVCLVETGAQMANKLERP